MNTPTGPALVLCLWNGTTDRVHSFPATRGQAADALRENWRLYLQLVPEGKYAPGDYLDNADILNPDFQV